MTGSLITITVAMTSRRRKSIGIIFILNHQYSPNKISVYNTDGTIATNPILICHIISHFSPETIKIFFLSNLQRQYPAVILVRNIFGNETPWCQSRYKHYFISRHTQKIPDLRFNHFKFLGRRKPHKLLKEKLILADNLDIFSCYSFLKFFIL